MGTNADATSVYTFTEPKNKKPSQQHFLTLKCKKHTPLVTCLKFRGGFYDCLLELSLHKKTMTHYFSLKGNPRRGAQEWLLCSTKTTQSSQTHTQGATWAPFFFLHNYTCSRTQCPGLFLQRKWENAHAQKLRPEVTHFYLKALHPSENVCMG